MLLWTCGSTRISTLLCCLQQHPSISAACNLWLICLAHISKELLGQHLPLLLLHQPELLLLLLW